MAEKKSPPLGKAEREAEGKEVEGGRTPTPIVYTEKEGVSSPSKKICSKIVTGLIDKTCFRCGKNFVPTRPVYAWGDCCSYTCWLHRDDYKTRGTGKAKPCEMYSRDGVFIRSFNSAAEGARFVGISKPENIRDCCNGKIHSSGGYLWKWKE